MSPKAEAVNDLLSDPDIRWRIRPDPNASRTWVADIRQSGPRQADASSAPPLPGITVKLKLTSDPFKRDASQVPWRNQPIAQSRALSEGVRLYATLPPEMHVQPGGGSHEPIRLFLSIQGREAESLVWEWIARDNETPLVLGSDVHLAREIRPRFALFPFELDGTVRVLVLVSNARYDHTLDVGRELNTFQSALDPSVYEVRVEVDPTRDNLVDALQWRPHIIHYVGDADAQQGQGCILLHDAAKCLIWLSAAEFGSMLPVSVRLLCLTTCVTAANDNIASLSRIALAPASTQLPTTISNQYAVTSAGASAFWQTFYPSLTRLQFDVVAAVAASRKATAEKQPDFADWGSFMLTVRDGHGILFRSSTSVQGPDMDTYLNARLANLLAARAETLAPDAATLLLAAAHDTWQGLDKP